MTLADSLTAAHGGKFDDAGGGPGAAERDVRPRPVP